MENTQISIPAPTLIKHLASCNKPTRDKALKLIKNWLPSQQELADEDLKKLWKGLFYCVWHADKAPVQSELINSLSSLLNKLPLALSERYLSVFLLTMRREWTGIDKHRLDKFYLLIRRFMYSFFMLLKKNNWDLEVTRTFVGVLESRTFFADDKFLGNGVNYHVASVFLEELRSFLPVRSEVLEILFKCLFDVMGKCQDRVLISKIKCNVFDVLVTMGRELLERKKSGDKVEGDMYCVGTVALTMGFSGKFFELGSSPHCVQANRKILYGLHEQFLKLEKDLEVSGIEISNFDVGIEEGEEVLNSISIASGEDEVNKSSTELVPIFGEMEIGDSLSKSAKKKKKVKKESDESSKKKKKKNVVISENKDEDMINVNGFESVDELANNGNIVDASKCVASGEKELNMSSTELIPIPGEMEYGASAGKSSKKKKKVKKESHGSKKNKNKDAVFSSENKDEGVVTVNGFDAVIESANNGDGIDFNESVVSNLRMQFEKVATEVGLDEDGPSSLDSPEATKCTISKKRKRARSVDGKKKNKADLSGGTDMKDVGAETNEKSAKKVRFSIKNNIVWKPHSPMPSQDLRLPPSVTPRGSALKKGLSPGPIKEMPPATKKPKLKKKGLKGNKQVAPGIRRRRKLQGLTM